MAVTYTNETSEKLYAPAYIVATLYGDGDTAGSPSGDSYILEDVIRDTTNGSQEDNDVTDIECETSDSPILSIVKRGAITIEAEVADTQADLLIALCGFASDGTKVYAPARYQLGYIKFDIVYKLSDGSLVAWVYPKVQLNTTMLIEELNSNPNRIKLAGTARDISVTVDGETMYTPFYKETGYTLPTEESTE